MKHLTDRLRGCKFRVKFFMNGVLTSIFVIHFIIVEEITAYLLLFANIMTVAQKKKSYEDFTYRVNIIGCTAPQHLSVSAQESGIRTPTQSRMALHPSNYYTHKHTHTYNTVER
jgi:hypothetical protein